MDLKGQREKPSMEPSIMHSMGLDAGSVSMGNVLYDRAGWMIPSLPKALTQTGGNTMLQQSPGAVTLTNPNVMITSEQVH